jgi:hypothetical protein
VAAKKKERKKDRRLYLKRDQGSKRVVQPSSIFLGCKTPKCRTHEIYISP